MALAKLLSSEFIEGLLNLCELDSPRGAFVVFTLTDQSGKLIASKRLSLSSTILMSVFSTETSERPEQGSPSPPPLTS